MIDSYKKLIPVEKNLFICATYLAFFPQLIIGPIERAGDLIPQLKNQINLDQSLIDSGINLIIFGLFKKIVLANNIFFFTTLIFSDYKNSSGLLIILAILFFRYQLYYDLSGYSDIAVGSARLFGIKLSNNFNRPLFSKSIAEYWSRWHITLMRWFKDYIFFAIAKFFRKRYQIQLCLLCTFILVGLWHEISLNWFLWGFTHGMIFFLSNFYYNITGSVS